MATLLELAQRGAISKIDAVLEQGQAPFRVIYASPKLEEWIKETLPRLASAWKLEIRPLEQLEQLVADFASDEPLCYERQFNPLYPRGDSTWELKTADLRVFGWFPLKDHFIGVVADETWRVKEYNLYRGYSGEVVRFRNNLPLDNPKFIAGDDPNAVVSNFYYPEPPRGR